MYPLHSICVVLAFALFSTSGFAQETKNSKWRSGQVVHLRKQDAAVAESFVKVVNHRGWQGGPIRVGGKTYQHGLGVHADSKLVFELNEEFKTFIVTPGPDDSHHGVLRMKIIIDENEVFDSGPTHSKDGTERKQLELSVEGANKLTLLVLMSNGTKAGDHASWAGARLIRSETERQPAVATAPQATLMSKEKLQPFFENYCANCHGEETQEADVRFDQIAWEITSNDEAQRWQDVLDQLNSGDMPPEGEDHPESDELAETLDVLTKSLVSARKRLTDHGGEIKLRRLNRREYSNTIRHLFGFDIVPDEMPEDGEFASFDTVGEEQLFTSSHFEKYLDLGTRVAKEGFVWNTTKYAPVKKMIDQPERDSIDKIRTKLAELDEKMAMKKAGKTWKEMGFKDEGEAEIIFRQFESRAEWRRDYLQYPHLDTGVYLNDVFRTIRFRRLMDIRGEYTVRIHGGVVGTPDDIRKILKISNRLGIVGTVKMKGTPEQPQTVELVVRQPLGHRFLALDFKENAPSFTANTMRRYLKKLQGQSSNWDPWASIWVDRIEVEGPFYPDDRSVVADLLYPNQPVGGKSPYLNVDLKSRDFIERFTFEAFRRRAPSTAYVDTLHDRFKANRAAGKRWTDAMSEVFGIVLASPEFLYVHEHTEPGTRNLDSRELAVRLAYFLWSSPPDEALYAADLLNEDVLASQIDRLLDDQKSDSFIDGFVSQWAEFDRFDAITIDEIEHFRFNEGLRLSAKREVKEFFKAMIRENIEVSNLIDSDFLTIDPTLAIHYGIEGTEITQDGFQRVNLPEDSPRGGLMTQAAFLITGSNGERSSPVIRGALVMEKLLHDKPAPPPPNVPELGSSDGKPLTNRQLVKLHQGQAVCASCHRKMDAIGFGLENFDTIGAWRTKEQISRKKKVDIDPSGTLPDGKAFTNVNELKQLLLQNEDKLARELTESILAYGLGRTVEFSDADAVDELLAKVAKQGNGLRSIIREVALSELFKQK